MPQINAIPDGPEDFVKLFTSGLRGLADLTEEMLTPPQVRDEQAAGEESPEEAEEQSPGAGEKMPPGMETRTKLADRIDEHIEQGSLDSSASDVAGKLRDPGVPLNEALQAWRAVANEMHTAASLRTWTIAEFSWALEALHALTQSRMVMGKEPTAMDEEPGPAWEYVMAGSYQDLKDLINWGLGR